MNKLTKSNMECKSVLNYMTMYGDDQDIFILLMKSLMMQSSVLGLNNKEIANLFLDILIEAQEDQKKYKEKTDGI